MNIIISGKQMDLTDGIKNAIEEKLGIPIYIAAVIVFGGRIFDNFGSIRRILLEKYKNRQRGD